MQVPNGHTGRRGGRISLIVVLLPGGSDHHQAAISPRRLRIQIQVPNIKQPPTVFDSSSSEPPGSSGLAAAPGVSEEEGGSGDVVGDVNGPQIHDHRLETMRVSESVRRGISEGMRKRTKMERPIKRKKTTVFGKLGICFFFFFI